MNWTAVLSLARRDMLVVQRTRALMAPLIFVPMMLLVALPLAFALGPSFVRDPAAQARLGEILSVMPQLVTQQLGEGPPAERWARFVHMQLLPSLFLIVPFMVANVLAADSFAGERERKTLEALLYTPLTDMELFVAKLLGPWLAAILVATVGFILTSAVIAVATLAIFGRPAIPNSSWIVLAVWVAPAFTAVGLACMVRLSLRVRGTQEAVQLGGLLVLPAVALLVGQVRGALLLGHGLLAATGAMLWVLAGSLLWFGVRRFRRTRLVTLL
jgi:hypothetical protein